MRVIETIGVPGPLEPANAALEADAIVIALKSRTIPRSHALAQSLHACRWLRKHGAQQIYFQNMFDLRLHPGRKHRAGDRVLDGRVEL
jgi:3-dehydrotetronate 4-kinase